MIPLSLNPPIGARRSGSRRLSAPLFPKESV